MSQDQPDYLSYLLRPWRVSGNEESYAPEKVVWRSSLEDPHTRERKAFAGLDELFDFLRTEVGQGRGPRV